MNMNKYTFCDILSERCTVKFITLMNYFFVATLFFLSLPIITKISTGFVDFETLTHKYMSITIIDFCMKHLVFTPYNDNIMNLL